MSKKLEKETKVQKEKNTKSEELSQYPREEWEIDEDADFYCANFFGKISGFSSSFEGFIMKKNNIYKNKEEILFALEMYEFCEKRSFEPNWEDFNQKKFWILLDYEDKKAYIDGRTYVDRVAPFCYPSKEKAQEVIDKYTFDELVKYYGRV